MADLFGSDSQRPGEIRAVGISGHLCSAKWLALALIALALSGCAQTANGPDTVRIVDSIHGPNFGPK